MRWLIRVTLVGFGAFAIGGALLGLLAVARGHYPFLDPQEFPALWASWAGLAGLYGAVVGALGGLLSIPLRSAARRWGVAAGVIALGVASVVAAGLAFPYSVWDELGPAVRSAPASDVPFASDRPNLVLISIDTLRADHLGLYGYPRSTSPEIDRLAARGAVFERAIAQAPETRRSMAALMTGLYPYVFDYERTLRDNTGPVIGDGFATLAERLKAAGYSTTGFVSNPVLRAENGYAQGFETWDEETGMFGTDDFGLTRNVSHVVEPALEWAKRAKPPFLLMVHVMDPHHPYQPEEPGPWENFDEEWRAGLARRWRSLSLPEDTKRMKALRDGSVPFEARELEYLVDRYDSEIRQVDAGVARLIRGLARLGYDDQGTLFVVTADHGEEFFEHSGLLHGHTLFDELIRVPLIVWGPGIPRGKRVGAQVRVVDVPATFVDWAGLESGDIDGVSLRPFLSGGGAPDRPALAVRGERYIVLRTGAWKLVAAFEPYDFDLGRRFRPADFIGVVSRALGKSKRDEIGLWDLRSDPAEQTNLLEDHREHALSLYRELTRERSSSPLRLVESSAGAGPSEDTLERLRALGYTD